MQLEALFWLIGNLTLVHTGIYDNVIILEESSNRLRLLIFIFWNKIFSCIVVLFLCSDCELEILAFFASVLLLSFMELFSNYVTDKDIIVELTILISISSLLFKIEILVFYYPKLVLLINH